MPNRSIQIPALTGKIYFKDPEFDGQLLRTIGYSHCGGSTYGECMATAFQITEGDHQSWWQHWHHLANTTEQIAKQCEAEGHPISAYQAYLRACEYYRQSEFFLRDHLDDPRILQTADNIRHCFQKYIGLADIPCKAIEIPFQGKYFYGYYLRADHTDAPRPTIICPTGYDSYAEEYYFNGCQDALVRDYNMIIFDGPGQGHTLRREKVYFRPDWENIIPFIAEYAKKLPGVDQNKLILMGRSFGGFLAARAASSNLKWAALICDPGAYDLYEVARNFLPESVIHAIEQHDDEKAQAFFDELFQQIPSKRFYFESRMRAHGIKTIPEYIREIKRYTLEGHVKNITCPTIICNAVAERLSSGQAESLYNNLECPKYLLSFTTAEGAADHGEAGNLALAFQRILDRLDNILKKP